jgi:hypothetical protein
MDMRADAQRRGMPVNFVNLCVLCGEPLHFLALKKQGDF